jgi:hypothetical protein
MYKINVKESNYSFQSGRNLAQEIFDQINEPAKELFENLASLKMVKNTKEDYRKFLVEKVSAHPKMKNYMINNPDFKFDIVNVKQTLIKEESDEPKKQKQKQKNKLKAFFRAFRKRTGTDIDDIADRCDISISQAYRIIGGDVEVMQDHRVALCDLFKIGLIDLSALLGEDIPDADESKKKD